MKAFGGVCIPSRGMDLKAFHSAFEGVRRPSKAAFKGRSLTALSGQFFFELFCWWQHISLNQARGGHLILAIQRGDSGRTYHEILGAKLPTFPHISPKYHLKKSQGPVSTTDLFVPQILIHCQNKSNQQHSSVRLGRSCPYQDS